MCMLLLFLWLHPLCRRVDFSGGAKTPRRSLACVSPLNLQCSCSHIEMAGLGVMSTERAFWGLLRRNHEIQALVDRVSPSLGPFRGASYQRVSERVSSPQSEWKEDMRGKTYDALRLVECVLSFHLFWSPVYTSWGVASRTNGMTIHIQDLRTFPL